MQMISRSRGTLYGLVAAACFGVSTPISKLLLDSVAPQLLAGLLYLGAAVALTAYRTARTKSMEARLRVADLRHFLPMVIFGGVVAPVLMLVGLAEVGATTGSLLLNLEAPFTMLIALLFFGDHMGRRALMAAGLIVGGALALRVQGGSVTGELGGAVLIALACLCWGLDNNYTQRLSNRDPVAVVQGKTLIAGSTNLFLAVGLGQPLPAGHVIVATLALGAVSYGLSVLFDAYALRALGAAREAAFMATSPFLGVLASAAIFRESPTRLEWLACAAMVAGVVLLVREKHSHRHRHDAIAHEHSHVHDEHHAHAHGPTDPRGEPHSHWHVHDETEHEHPHAPDVHHRHRH
jgi:drug/metabolite transporter (DMT)-like permease